MSHHPMTPEELQALVLLWNDKKFPGQNRPHRITRFVGGTGMIEMEDTRDHHDGEKHCQSMSVDQMKAEIASEE